MKQKVFYIFLAVVILTIGITNSMRKIKDISEEKEPSIIHSLSENIIFEM